MVATLVKVRAALDEQARNKTLFVAVGDMLGAKEPGSKLCQGFPATHSVAWMDSWSASYYDVFVLTRTSCGEWALNCKFNPLKSGEFTVGTVLPLITKVSGTGFSTTVPCLPSNQTMAPPATPVDRSNS